jgi:Ser/Thr protein kinase RdoA (MazF antagonist)
MLSLGRWVERLQERDAVCAAVLALAAALKSSVTHRPGQFEEDFDDRLVGDARVQLAQLIEDPVLASAIAHALQILCRRWEAECHEAGQASPAGPVSSTVS